MCISFSGIMVFACSLKDVDCDHERHFIVVAISIKEMINALVTVIALPVFIFSGKISWGPALGLAAGVTVGGWVGAKWTVEGGERVVRWVMVVAALGLSGKLAGLYG